MTEANIQKIKKIALIGEVMIELIATDDDKASIGVAGDSYNTAVYLSRLAGGQDLSVTYVTALGNDSFSKRITSAIERHGINTDCIEYRDNETPGLYAIETDPKGERSFSYWRNNSAAKTLFQRPCQIEIHQLSQFDLIYLSGISVAILPDQTRRLLIDYLKSFRKAGGKIAFDSNFRPKLWEDYFIARKTMMQMWEITDIALPSVDDEMELFGESNEAAVVTRLQNAGVKFGALKRGEVGPLAIGPKNNGAEFDDIVFNPVSKVIDTTAAGDSFNAGFLYQYALGASLGEAMKAGHDLASKVIQSRGAIINFDNAEHGKFG